MHMGQKGLSVTSGLLCPSKHAEWVDVCHASKKPHLCPGSCCSGENLENSCDASAWSEAEIEGRLRMNGPHYFPPQ